MLWPYVSILKGIVSPTNRLTNIGFAFLYVGLINGFLVGLERLLIYDWSESLVSKAHEIIAILMFAGLYLGVIIISLSLMYRNRRLLLPVAMVLLPIFAIAASQLYLYFDQRDLGWVNVQWRDMGVPFWLSFAFWQWLAAGSLYLSMGALSFIVAETRSDI